MSSTPKALTAEAGQWLAGRSHVRADDLILRLATALRRMNDPVMIVTPEELDALPLRSIVGVDDSPISEVRSFSTRLVCFERCGTQPGRDSWLELDPGDRDDGERLHPSAYLIARSSRFGKCAPRIRLLHRGESS